MRSTGSPPRHFTLKTKEILRNLSRTTQTFLSSGMLQKKSFDTKEKTEYRSLAGSTKSDRFLPSFIPLPPTHPPTLVRFEEPDYDCNMFDSGEIQWYQLKIGVMGDDDRDLFIDKAGLYPIATWFGTDQSYLAINLRDPSDGRIHEFSGADYWDMSFNGESLEEESQPAFTSYSRMLSRILEFKFADGSTVLAGQTQHQNK